MKKWMTLSLSLALFGSSVLPAAAFAETVPAQSAAAEEAGTELTPELLEALDYADRLDAIVKYEDKAADAFNAVGYISAKNRKQVYLALNNTIVPNYSKFYYLLKQIKPTPGTKLAKIHAQYLQGVSLQLEGMQLIKKSLYGANINWTTYDKGQAKLKSGKAKLDLFINQFQTYMDGL